MSDRPVIRWLRSPAVWPAAGLAALLLANTIYGWQHGRNFLELGWHDGQLKGSLVNIFKNGSYTMALALGMTLVIATGGIDLSVGAVMATTGAVAAQLLNQGAHSITTALLAAGGVALLFGLANGLLVARARIQPIVATLALMVAGRGLAQLVTGGNVIIVKNPVFDYLGKGTVGGLPFAPLCVMALYLIVWLGLRRTAAGLFLEAVGDNGAASRFAGLPAERVKTLAYAACGLCAGLAGLLKAADIHAADPYNLGDSMELDAIFAVVVGGTALSGGRICLAGSFLGALLLQTLTVSMFYLGVDSAVAPMPKAVVIVAVCLAQSETVRRWFARQPPSEKLA